MEPRIIQDLKASGSNDSLEVGSFYSIGIKSIETVEGGLYHT